MTAGAPKCTHCKGEGTMPDGTTCATCQGTGNKGGYSTTRITAGQRGQIVAGQGLADDAAPRH